jgi:hypothetical protein
MDMMCVTAGHVLPPADVFYELNAKSFSLSLFSNVPGTEKPCSECGPVDIELLS